MNKKFDEQDSLRVISEMINTARGNLRIGAGKYMILWGYIVFVASLMQFIEFNCINFTHSSGNLWILAYGLGIIITIILAIKDKKASIVRTYTDSITSSIWIGFMVGAILVSFLLSGKYGFFIYPAILYLYTFCVFMTCAAYKFRWMYWSVIVCIVCLCFYKFIPFTYYPLPMAIAILCGNIISGHILNYKAKKYV